MKEAELARATRQILAQSGLVHWRVQNGGQQYNIGGRSFMRKSEIAGFPDWAGVTRSGGFFALELKSPKGRTSEEQITWLEKLSNTNAIVGIARSVQDVVEFVETVGGKVPKLL